MAKYTYVGNRDANNSAVGIIYKAPGDDSKYQGTVVEEGELPLIQIGGEIELTAAERDRLSPIFILEDKKGEDVGEGTTPPTTVAPDANTGGDAGTSGSAGTLGEQSSPSATSKSR